MFGCIVAGVAKTDTAQGAAKAAIDLAERNGAALHLVIAVAKSDPGAREDGEAFLSSLTTLDDVHQHVIPGDPGDAILMVAAEVNADLIVVGNKGMRGARRVLGSVPNKVAHGTDASILIVDSTG